VVLIFVDDVDLATFAAVRYARGLRPTTMRAVHFVIDSAQAETLREQWVRYGQDIPLEMIDTPDRRLTRASLELVSREAEAPGTQVTVVLPRRGYAPLLGRLLHDRTADKIASVISQVPDSAATIIPFDVESRVHLLHARNAAQLAAGDQAQPGADQVEPGSVREKEKEQPTASGTRPQRATVVPPAVAGNGTATAAANGVTSIAALEKARKATIEGRVSSVEIRPVENSCVFETTIADSTGSLTAMFYGRTHIPGFEPGVRVRLDGKVSMRGGGPAMINPAYELLAKGE
jgi:hypothetical protein